MSNAIFPDKPTIAVIGSGAVGGYYGARLAQHEFDVHFLLRSDYDAVSTRGWKIKSCDGDFELLPNQFHSYADSESMPAVDLVIITLKATANADLPTIIPPLMKDNTVLLTLQNGLGNEEFLAEHFGDQRVLGGLAFTCINRTGPGELHHSDHGLIRIGEFQRPPSDRLRAISTMFNSSKVICELLENLRHGRWEKLIWNVPFNGLGAAMDLTTDQLIRSESGLQLIRELMREIIATAASENIFFPEKIIQAKIEHTQTMGAYYTSMQIDRRMHRPLEIDAIINGPLQVARVSGVKTPQLELLKKLLAVF